MSKSDMIDIDTIYANPKQARRTFHNLESLAASILEHGVIVPIVVVKRKNGYMIIGGERRYRASKMAGLKRMPVRILRANSRQVAAMSLVENIQRSDLNVIEEASGYRDLMDTGMTMEEVAEQMGFKQAWRVRERLDLLKLDPMFQGFVKDKRLSPSQATEMARLSIEDQHTLYNKILDGKAGTFNQLRALANALLAPEPKQLGFGPELSARESEVGTKYDRLVERLKGFLDQSFSADDLKILERVVKSRVSANIAKLDIIIAELQKIRKAMTEAQGKQEIESRRSRQAA